MKNTKKLIWLAIIASSLFVFSSANAMSIIVSWSGTYTPIDWWIYTNKLVPASKEEIEMLKRNSQEMMKQNHSATKEATKANITNFHQENGNITQFFKNTLTEEEKTELKKTLSDREAMSKMYAEKMMAAKKAWEDTTALEEEIKTKREGCMNRLLKFVDETKTESFKDFCQKRWEVAMENKDLRQETAMKNQVVRQKTKTKIWDIKAKYKELFITKYKNILDKVPTERIPQIITKIENQIEKVNSNTTLSQTRKNKLLWQLYALLEILEEKLIIPNEDELNIEDLLK